jgi:hypothetical protein
MRSSQGRNAAGSRSDPMRSQAVAIGSITTSSASAWVRRMEGDALKQASVLIEQALDRLGMPPAQVVDQPLAQLRPGCDLLFEIDADTTAIG